MRTGASEGPSDPEDVVDDVVFVDVVFLVDVVFFVDVGSAVVLLLLRAERTRDATCEMADSAAAAGSMILVVIEVVGVLVAAD